MTPPALDLGVVQTRLALIEQLLDDLERTGDVDADRLARDRMLRHAVERILSQIVDLAVSINSHVASAVLATAPKDYRTSFDLADEAGLLAPDLVERLKPSVGLRNVLAHEYVEVDLALVAAATRLARSDYRTYVRAVSSWLRQRLTQA